MSSPRQMCDMYRIFVVLVDMSFDSVGMYVVDSVLAEGIIKQSTKMASILKT